MQPETELVKKGSWPWISWVTWLELHEQQNKLKVVSQILRVLKNTQVVSDQEVTLGDFIHLPNVSFLYIFLAFSRKVMYHSLGVSCTALRLHIASIIDQSCTGYDKMKLLMRWVTERKQKLCEWLLLPGIQCHHGVLTAAVFTHPVFNRPYWQIVLLPNINL